MWQITLLLRLSVSIDGVVNRLCAFDINESPHALPIFLHYLAKVSLESFVVKLGLGLGSSCCFSSSGLLLVAMLIDLGKTEVGHPVEVRPSECNFLQYKENV